MSTTSTTTVNEAPIYTFRIGQLESNYHFMCGAVFYRELPLGIVEVKMARPARGVRNLLKTLQADFEKDNKKQASK